MVQRAPAVGTAIMGFAEPLKLRSWDVSDHRTEGSRMRRPHLQVGAVTITSEFGKARGLEFIVRSASTRPRMLPPASLAQRRRTQVLERGCRRSLIYHREMAQCTAPVYGHRSEGHQVGAWLRTARRDQPSETVIGPSSR